eukprot:1367384-Prymnesium_polylepis.1
MENHHEILHRRRTHPRLYYSLQLAAEEQGRHAAARSAVPPPLSHIIPLAGPTSGYVALRQL